MHKLSAFVVVLLALTGCQEQGPDVEQLSASLTIEELEHEAFSQWIGPDGKAHTAHTFDIKGSNWLIGCFSDFDKEGSIGGCSLTPDKDTNAMYCAPSLCWYADKTTCSSSCALAIRPRD